MNNSSLIHWSLKETWLTIWCLVLIKSLFVQSVTWQSPRPQSAPSPASSSERWSGLCPNPSGQEKGCHNWCFEPECPPPRLQTKTTTKYCLAVLCLWVIGFPFAKWYTYLGGIGRTRQTCPSSSFCWPQSPDKRCLNSPAEADTHCIWNQEHWID